MGENKIDIRPDYLTGQTITYFFISILAMFAAGLITDKPVYGADKPWFFLEKSGIIPLPVFNIQFNLAYWMIVVLSLILLCISLFFLISLFRGSWIRKATKLAYQLSPYFSLLILLSFILSWLTGLNSLLTTLESGILVVIFIYASPVIFLGLVFHTIKSLVIYSKRISEEG